MRCSDATDARRYQGIIGDCDGNKSDGANLIFCGLCVEHGEQHVAITVAFCAICSEDVSERGRGYLGDVSKGAGGRE